MEDQNGGDLNTFFRSASSKKLPFGSMGSTAQNSTARHSIAQSRAAQPLLCRREAVGEHMHAPIELHTLVVTRCKHFVVLVSFFAFPNSVCKSGSSNLPDTARVDTGKKRKKCSVRRSPQAHAFAAARIDHEALCDLSFWFEGKFADCHHHFK
jgi:hypothetical protein